MQSEEAVDVERAALGAGTRHRNRRPRPVVRRLAVRDDHVQTVDRTALKNRHERLVALRRRGVRHPDENIRKQGPADEGEPGGFEEEASVDHLGLRSGVILRRRRRWSAKRGTPQDARRTPRLLTMGGGKSRCKHGGGPSTVLRCFGYASAAPAAQDDSRSFGLGSYCR